MDQSDHKQTESPQGDRAVPDITLFERVRLWNAPIVTALISIPIFLISALTLLFYFPRHLHPLDKFLLIASVILLVISAITLWGSASGFHRIIRRKIKTGSFFPAGDDLVEWRKSLHRAAGWQRIVIPAAFCVFAIGSTHQTLATPYSFRPTVWILPALMWIAATLIIFIFALPSAPKWIEPAVAVVWCITGFWYMVSVLASHSRGIEYWLFPFVMFLMAAILLAGIIRRPKQNLLDPHRNQAPPI